MRLPRFNVIQLLRINASSAGNRLIRTYRQATHNFDCSKFAWKQLEWTSSLQHGVTATSLHKGTPDARNSPQLMQVQWAE